MVSLQTGFVLSLFITSFQDAVALRLSLAARCDLAIASAARHGRVSFGYPSGLVLLTLSASAHIADNDDHRTPPTRARLRLPILSAPRVLGPDEVDHLVRTVTEELGTRGLDHPATHPRRRHLWPSVVDEESRVALHSQCPT